MKLEGKRVLITGVRAALTSRSPGPSWRKHRSTYGTQRAYAKGEPFSAQHVLTEEGKKLLFGQIAASVARH